MDDSRTGTETAPTAPPKWKVRGNNLLIQMDAAPEVTAGGLAIPIEAREKPTTGTVLALGDGVTKIVVKGNKMGPIKTRVPDDSWFVGQRVVVAEYGGVPCEMFGPRVCVIPPELVLVRQEKPDGPA